MIKGLGKKLIVSAIGVGLSLSSISCCGIDCQFEKAIQENRDQGPYLEKSKYDFSKKDAEKGAISRLNKRIVYSEAKTY